MNEPNTLTKAGLPRKSNAGRPAIGRQRNVMSASIAPKTFAKVDRIAARKKMSRGQVLDAAVESFRG